MGLLGSVFGSSSSSNKKSTTNYNTTTTTTSNTTSNMRDVGLTGQAAVSLADVVTDTAAKLNNANLQYNSKTFGRILDTVDKVNNTVSLNIDRAGDFSNQLLSGAIDAASNLTSTAKSVGEDITLSAQMAGENILSRSESLSESENKNLIPVILIGVVGLVWALKGL